MKKLNQDLGRDEEELRGEGVMWNVSDDGNQW